MLFQTVLDELERRDLATAMVAMCTGGGMGTATIIERVRWESTNHPDHDDRGIDHCDR
jgi:hypothetical protein